MYQLKDSGWQMNKKNMIKLYTAYKRLIFDSDR